MNSSNNIYANTSKNNDNKEVYKGSKENNFPLEEDVELSRMLNTTSIKRKISLTDDLKCGIWIFQGPSLQRLNFVF